MNGTFPFLQDTVKVKGMRPFHSNSGCVFFYGEKGTASCFRSCSDQIFTDSCIDWKFPVGFQPSNKRCDGMVLSAKIKK